MPGNLMVVSPTEIASAATTKNQPPDIDIIMFQMSPGMAKGASNCQNAATPKAGTLRHLVQIARNAAQGLIEGKRHVPCLRGENGEDGRALG